MGEFKTEKQEIKHTKGEGVGQMVSYLGQPGLCEKGNYMGGVAWPSSSCVSGSMLVPDQHLYYSQKTNGQAYTVAIITGINWYLIVDFMCISLMAGDVQHLFLCLLAICISF